MIQQFKYSTSRNFAHNHTFMTFKCIIYWWRNESSMYLSVWALQVGCCLLLCGYASSGYFVISYSFMGGFV